jgi:adenine deaminase
MKRLVFIFLFSLGLGSIWSQQKPSSFEIAGLPEWAQRMYSATPNVFQVKSWGSALRAPYMTLSFMALLVIPELKLSDKGLFDGKRFTLLDQHQP